MSFVVRLEQFEGPFDLLLFFIQRDELDIHDIAISKITNDFLAYIKGLEKLNINVASEFILVASHLMRIKSKMLLPRKELDEQGEEVDPRADLVTRLLEYKKLKDTLVDFENLEKDRLRKKSRGNLTKELSTLTQKSLAHSELESLTLYRLLQAFRSAMHRLNDREKRLAHEVEMSRFTIDEEREMLLEKLEASKGKLSFASIFHACSDRLQAVVRFLALLDLLSSQTMTLQSGEGLNSFYVYKKTSDNISHT